MSRITEQIKTALFHRLREIISLFHARSGGRARLRQYIAGAGIEIGALHNPLNLSGLPVTEIRYVDRMSNRELRLQYPELKYLKLVPVDIIDDGEVLGKIEKGSLDFIIANHFLEHARNPLGCIENWLSKLKPGGIIFMAAPDKKYTFDVDRELTPLDHLVEDYRSSSKERLKPDRQHYKEWATLVDKVPVDEIEGHVRKLMEADYSIHFHTYTLQSFLEMLDYLKRKRKLPFEIRETVDAVHGKGEFLVMLECTRNE